MFPARNGNGPVLARPSWKRPSQANRQGSNDDSGHVAHRRWTCTATRPRPRLSKLGVQRSLGLPECATPPEEVYELAKRRGMDFVTITDHDTIDGCLEIADRPDVFISEELTAWFRRRAPGRPRRSAYGITPEDHEWLQAHARDLEACAAYLHRARDRLRARPSLLTRSRRRSTPRHRRRLAQLFPVWEIRNGSRARELNMPAADLHRDPRRNRHRRLRRPRRRGHRAHLDARRRPRRRRKSFCATSARAAPRPTASRAAPRSGRTPRWRWRPAALMLGRPTAVSDRARGSRGRAAQIAERVVGEGGVRGGAHSGDLGPGRTHGRCCAPGSTRSGWTCDGRALIDA